MNMLPVDQRERELPISAQRYDLPFMQNHDAWVEFSDSYKLSELAFEQSIIFIFLSLKIYLTKNNIRDRGYKYKVDI